ncbi:MAG: hypothetical protein IPN85_09060 [Flavobacteriales bacterium]|nr:hypothetical protein [Flavobacteriales bacterium]
MIIRYAFACLGSVAAAGLMAQSAGPNLVKNPGFEEFTTPVTTWDQLDRATGWSNANSGSCDVFTDVAKGTTVGIPENELGSGATAAGQVLRRLRCLQGRPAQNWKRVWTTTKVRSARPTRTTASTCRAN